MESEPAIIPFQVRTKPNIIVCPAHGPMYQDPTKPCLLCVIEAEKGAAHAEDGRTPAQGVKFVVKDSGDRQQFVSGMVRDVTIGKVECHRAFDGPMLERWVEHLTAGAAKYPDLNDGRPNWMLANGQAEELRFRESATRHFFQWMRGDTDEDHAAAVFFNINGFEYVKARRAQG